MRFYTIQYDTRQINDYNADRGPYLCSALYSQILIVLIKTEIKIVKLNSGLLVIHSCTIVVMMMMMVVVVVFDSGAGLRVMGGDGDISSSLYPQSARPDTTPTQPISRVRGRKTETGADREKFLFVFNTEFYHYLVTEHSEISSAGSLFPPARADSRDQ